MFEWLKKNLTAVYIIVAAITIIAPWLLTRDWSGIDFTETGQIGDTIGGLTAPFLNLLSVTLLYLTLKEQIKINKRQEYSTTTDIAIKLYESIESRVSSLIFLSPDRKQIYEGVAALILFDNQTSKGESDFMSHYTFDEFSKFSSGLFDVLLKYKSLFIILSSKDYPEDEKRNMFFIFNANYLHVISCAKGSTQIAPDLLKTIIDDVEVRYIKYADSI